MRQTASAGILILTTALLARVVIAPAQEAGELQRQVLAHYRTIQQHKAKLDQAARALYHSRTKLNRRLAQQETGERKVALTQEASQEYKTYLLLSAKVDRQLEQLRALSAKLTQAAPRDASVEKDLAQLCQALASTLNDMQAYGQKTFKQGTLAPDPESPRNRRQIAQSQFQEANQKASQYLALLSSLMKTLNELQSGVIRKIR